MSNKTVVTIRRVKTGNFFVLESTPFMGDLGTTIYRIGKEYMVDDHKSHLLDVFHLSYFDGNIYRKNSGGVSKDWIFYTAEHIYSPSQIPQWLKDFILLEEMK